uniref:Uncharacterized protein n=1 Tax=Rhizophora mucronata TaxID=61149 RepID=A0A2P2QCF2_RHIMU
MFVAIVFALEHVFALFILKIGAI